MKTFIITLCLFWAVTGVTAQNPSADSSKRKAHADSVKQKADADSVKQAAHADSLKNRFNYIQALISQVEKIDALASHLSLCISRATRGAPLDTNKPQLIESYLANIKNGIDKLPVENLKPYLKGAEPDNFEEEVDNFKTQGAQMNEELTAFKNNTKDTLYAIQIDYNVDKVKGFLTSTGNFKQYLISLAQTPITPVDMLLQIKLLLKITDSLVTINKSTIQKIDTFQHIYIPKIESIDSLIDRKADVIKRLLQRDTIKYRSYMMISAYAGNVFGLNYFHRIGDPKPAVPCYYWGAELIVPAGSVTGKTAGGFILGALRDDKLLLQAGLGYLSSTRTREDISWKAAILYIPRKLGLGISYSPLTGVGLQIGYRW